jgi:CRP-like cAMP-binding protein
VSAAVAARLSLHPVLARLSPAARAELAARGVVRKLPRRRRLFHEGEAPDALAFVLSGRLDVARDGEHGEPIILRRLGPDSVVGLSLAAGAAASADVVAGEATEVLVIPGSLLRALLAREPEAAFAALAHLADLVAALSDELEELRCLDIEERLRRRLARWAASRHEIHVTHAELAAQIGASRANVSRALKRLEAAGVVRRRRGRLELCR